jgi:cob(I)alamin adenosyltransferase
MKRNSKKNGLVIVYTGNGKGKTTAALGLALRATGYNQKVLILQFIKGTWETGELKAIEKLKTSLQIKQLGKGFITFKNGKAMATKEQKNNALQSFKYAYKKVISNLYNIIILDEINNLIDYKLVDVNKIIDLIKNKPSRLSLVLTGRDAHKKIINISDIVTEMKEIKHIFKKGIKAKKGLDY